MTTLTVNVNGQVTLKEEILRHLGLRPGQKLKVDPLPDGNVLLKKMQKKRMLSEAFGILKGKTNLHLSVEEISQIAQEGWAHQK